jgi:hypothetical protein
MLILNTQPTPFLLQTGLTGASLAELVGHIADMSQNGKIVTVEDVIWIEV